MSGSVSCPRCGCSCRVQPHDSAHCVQCFTTFRPSLQTPCPHCGAAFTSQLGVDTDAGRYCNACGQYEGFPDANHGPRLPYACPDCEQLSDIPGRCPSCAALVHEPQGEAVKLFEPAPAQMPGQLGF